MGRMKVQLKKIENKTYRHITFAKRKSGLVKKAHELSILCDVEIALIIFSPAGKLILFDAKKRMEEILEHYLDLPIQQRGRLHNEELIQRMVAQMNLEASIQKHLKSRGNIIHSEPILEDIQSQILSRTSELEDIERQIMCYVGNPSCIKTMGEAEYQEKELEKTLKCIRIHKQFLEANNRCTQLPSELAFQQEIVNAVGDVMRSSSHISNNPSHIDPAIPAMDFAGYNDGFQTLSNQHTLAEILQPPPLGMLHGYNFPSNNMPRSQFAQFGNTNFTTGMNFHEEGSARTNAVQSYVGDPTMSCYGTCSHNDYCGCRPPFPF